MKRLLTVWLLAGTCAFAQIPRCPAPYPCVSKSGRIVLQGNGAYSDIDDDPKPAIGEMFYLSPPCPREGECVYGSHGFMMVSVQDDWGPGIDFADVIAHNPANVKISQMLSNVIVDRDIRYCDEVSGDDAGAECVQRAVKVAPKGGVVIHYKADQIKPGEACPSGMHWQTGNSYYDSLADAQGVLHSGVGTGDPATSDYYFCERNKP